MNPPEDDHRQTGEETPRPETRALVPYDYRNDEIDLVEVGVSLWRRWKLMLVVFLACIAAGLLIAFLVPRSYEYTTTLEIGSRVVGTQIQPVESPGSAASKLKNGYLPEVLQQYARAHRLDARKFNFDVEAPAKADLVVISGKGTQAQAESYIAIEKAAAQLLVTSDARITRNQQVQLQAQLAQAQSKLDQLKDPANRQLLKSQIDSLQIYQKQARKQQLSASHRAGGASGAMTQLLLGNQVQQADQQLLTLKQRLNNLASNITSQKAAVTSLKTQLDNLQVTRIVAGPMQSLKHVGLGRSVIAILGAVVGVILALLAAAGANYLSAVRRRLQPEERAT